MKTKNIVTKKQVEEMYKEVVINWEGLREGDFSLVLTKIGSKVEWCFTDIGEKIENSFFIFENAYGLFEWVVLKEIGGRRKMNKQEIIEGIQWNISQNYLKSIA